MRRFRKSYPDVEFSIRNLLTETQLEMIGDGLLDVGFLRLPIENRKEIEVTTIHREPFVAILPSSHSLSTKKEIRLRELKGNPFVMYAREYAPGFHDLLTGILSNAGSRPEGGPNSRRDAYPHLSRRCRRGRLNCPSICCKEIRLQGGRVLDCGSTAGIRDWLGHRTS